MLNDLTSPLSLLATRRSGKPRDMVAPGPTPAELERILAIASRVPDHGKLTPWRFVIIEDRLRFAELLDTAFAQARPEASRAEVELQASLAQQAPLMIAVLSVPNLTSKVPVAEQHLSAGVAAFALELAATAMGYVAGWLTGWAAYSPAVVSALGGGEGASVAGFMFIGSPSRPLEERPRPLLSDVVSHWPGIIA